jgi:hypothetical protein
MVCNAPDEPHAYQDPAYSIVHMANYQFDINLPAERAEYDENARYERGV